MIGLYLLFFGIAVVAFVLLSGFGLPARIGIALAIFIILSAAATFWVAKVGDQPPPDARTIVPGSSSEAPKDTKPR